MPATARFEGQSDFAMFLRTGLRFRHQAGADVEVKFNPWHDPDDGRFTFAGQGSYFGEGQESGGADASGRSGAGRGGGGGSGDASPKKGSYEARIRADDEAITRRNENFDPNNPKNYSVYQVAGGDTLTKIAARRQGVTVADLAWLNDVDANAPLRIGQSIKLPNQDFLDAGRDAKSRFLGLAYYMDRHGGRLPPNPAKPPSIQQQLAEERVKAIYNGYAFETDRLDVVQRVSGPIPAEGRTTRSPRMQAKAGGPDRRRTDDGGHFVAPRFNGPRIQINHFPQNLSVNRGEYRVIENGWDVARKNGHRVEIDIRPVYPKGSRRPGGLRVVWFIDGVRDWSFLRNEKPVKKNVK